MRDGLASRSIVICSLLVAALATSGCFTSTPHLNSVASSLEEELDGATFEKEFGLKLGRISTSMARGIAGIALDDEDEDAQAVRATMKGIRRIEVATYETRGDLLIDGPFEFERTMEKRGWQTIARIREDDGFVWIVYEERKGALRGFMVVTLEEDELTLVQLRGRLDRTLAAAMKIAEDEADFASHSTPPDRSPSWAPRETKLQTDNAASPAP